MNTAAPPPAEEAPQAPVRVLGQYIKDLSFEVPQAPEIYSTLRETQPDIPITIDTSMRHLGGNSYEVTLSVHIEATAGDKKAFILELVYGSVVDINDRAVPSEAVHPLLLIEMPRQMFPFARQIIADLTIGGGFPPLLLQMIDFAELYRRKFGVVAQGAETPPANATIN